MSKNYLLCMLENMNASMESAETMVERLRRDTATQQFVSLFHIIDAVCPFYEKVLRIGGRLARGLL